MRERRVMARLLGRARSLLLPALCLAAVTATAAADAAALGELPLEPNILSSPALGPIPGDFATWSELFAVQERLNAAALRIFDDPHAAAHLAGIVAAPETRKLQVYWKGTIPAATETLLAELRRAVPIDVSPAMYSHAELLAAHRAAIQEPFVLEANPKVDGSGLHIVFDRAHRDEVRVDTLHAKLRSVLHAAPALDITYSRPGTFVATRDKPAVPAFAGAWINLEGGKEGCTLGVPVMNGTTRGWLTAEHCVGPIGKRVRLQSSSGQVIGTIGATDSPHDAAFIRASTQVVGRLYVGRPYGENASVPVAPPARNIVGNIVFASGAATGLNGALRIEQIVPRYAKMGIKKTPIPGCPIASSVCYEGTPVVVGYISDAVRARHISNLTAVGNGDSGGVAFSFTPDGRAQPRGILVYHEKENKVVCPSGHRLKSPDYCASEVIYTNLDKVIEAGTVATSVITSSWF